MGIKNKCKCNVKYSKLIKDTCCECYEGGYIDGINNSNLDKKVLLEKVREIIKTLKQ